MENERVDLQGVAEIFHGVSMGFPWFFAAGAAGVFLRAFQRRGLVMASP